MNLELYQRTQDQIAKWLAETKNPCVACSFGKDSMVMLNLIRLQRPDIPVVYFRHMEQGRKHAFADLVAKAWGLNMVYPSFRYRDFYGKLDHVEILDIFEIAKGQFVITPLEPQPELSTEQPFACGVDLLQELATPCESNFDAVFIGQRMDDKDVIMGDQIINAEEKRSGDFRYFFPLAKWTKKDIWAAIRRYKVPVDSSRYFDRDVNANNDVWNLCTRCLSGSEPVMCPKDQIEISGMADFLNLQERSEHTFNSVLNLKGDVK